MKKVLAALVLATPLLATAAEYSLDPSHTNATFYIDHFGTSTNFGIFNNLEGNLSFDAAKQTGKIDLIIPMSNLDTGRKQFDQHLQNADLFDAKKFPNMRFESSKWRFQDGKVTSIAGNLTIKGVTKPVVLTATKFNCYNSPIFKKEVCGGDFTTTIDRTDWGMDYLVQMGMSKSVSLVIHAEGVKK